jgi:hypothetical protein
MLFPLGAALPVFDSSHNRCGCGVLEWSRSVDDMDKKRWEDLSGAQRAGIVALGAAEVVVTTIAVIDLVRRPRSEVRGPKLLWFSLMPVQPLGPIAYLVAGRR